MEYNIIKVYQGKIVDEEQNLSLFQLCSKCSVPSDEIIEMVNHGILIHEGEHQTEWRFPYDTIHRIQKVRRLLYQLEVNMAGAALALHLLEQIENLEDKLNRFNLTEK